MARIGSVELERILEKICRKTRIIAEKPLPGKEIPYRESPSGRGLEWEIRGILAAESENELYEKERALQALADEKSKIFEEYDDPGMDVYDVLVSDVELSRLAGQLHRSGYTLRMLLKAIQYRRLAETYPSVAQQLLASLNYCLRAQPQTLPSVSQTLQYVLGMTASAQTLPAVSQLLSYITLQRTTYGKILYDNFNDNSLDPAWTYEEGISGNSVAEQNGRLEFIGAQHSYRHVQRTFGGVNNPILIVKANAVSASPEESTWGPGIHIWFNQYDLARLVIATSGDTFGACYDKDGTYTSNWVGSISANTWYWLKIKVTSSYLYFYSSTDGSTWTQQHSTDRPSTWTIDANSLLILGHGHEQNSSSYPNPDLDNNYSTTGSNVTSYFDDFIMIRGETITMNGLPNGWYFKVRKGGNYYQSSAASGGTASLDCASIETQAPFDELEVYNNNNQLILDNRFPGDVWPGDAYTYSSG